MPEDSGTASSADPGALFFGAFAGRLRPEPDRILRPGVGAQGEGLRAFLAAKMPGELVAEDIRTRVEGNLSMLAPDAFLYFLPAFLNAALLCYGNVSVFASELLGALTIPERSDFEQALDRAELVLPLAGMSGDLTDQLRKQQFEWFDSGVPGAIFHERADGVTGAEGRAILAFLRAFKEAHGDNFPFDELDVAIDRHWVRYA